MDFDFDHAFGFYDNLKNPYSAKAKYELFADASDMAASPFGDLVLDALPSGLDEVATLELVGIDPATVAIARDPEGGF